MKPSEQEFLAKRLADGADSLPELEEANFDYELYLLGFPNEDSDDDSLDSDYVPEWEREQRIFALMGS